MKLIDLIINANPFLKPSSIKVYKNSLKRLNGGEDPDSIDFLKDITSIKDILNGAPMSSQKNMIIAALVAGKSINDVPVIEIYTKMLIEINKEINSKLEKKQLSPSDTMKYKSLDELKQVQKQLEVQVLKFIKDSEISDKNMTTLRHYMIASLYTLTPAVRLDYGGMLIADNKKLINPDNNYLVIQKSKKYFLLQNFKNVKTFGITTLQVNKELDKVITLYKKRTSSAYFLYNSRGLPMSSTVLGKELISIFGVNLNLIRKAWVNSVVDGVQSTAQQQLAQQMLHTTGTQIKNYSKII